MKTVYQQNGLYEVLFFTVHVIAIEISLSAEFNTQIFIINNTT